MTLEQLPIAIIGAGPVGLAAAARVLERGMQPLVLEAGPSAGHNVDTWGHIRMFSPWKYNTDRASVALLEENGWIEPDGEHFPTGMELVGAYLKPLAAHPVIAPHVHYDARVLAMTRFSQDKMKDSGRDDAPFLIRTQASDGTEQSFLARAVIDASGTVSRPNPIGTGGISAVGEAAAAGRIVYGVPDLSNAERSRYAGKRVLVVGSGDSAFNALLNLITLKDEEPSTRIIWAVRRPAEAIRFGGGENDALPERGALGLRVKRIVESGAVELVSGFRTESIEQTGDGVVLHGGETSLPAVDEVIAVTGYGPDLEMLREVRLSLDPAVESPTQLAPLIDPNLHSCGTVRPHGAAELSHPERDFYIAGMKSYGRAPTFLMLTGYEQVRSIVAAIAGDWDAARDVQLELPETGVCSTGDPGLALTAASNESSGGCCAPSCCS